MLNFNRRETATILAALRLFQTADKKTREKLPHFDDIRALTNPEIDKLCEHVNFGDAVTENGAATAMDGPDFPPAVGRSILRELVKR